MMWKIQQAVQDDVIRVARVHSGNRAEVFIWQNFQHAYRDLGNQATTPPTYENIKNVTKDLEVRRDLGNRPSPPTRSCEEVLKAR